MMRLKRINKDMLMIWCSQAMQYGISFSDLAELKKVLI